MTNLINKKNIGQVILNEPWSLSGKKINLKLSDSDLCVSMNSLSKIRLLSNLEKIKTINEYYGSMFQTLNCSGSLSYKDVIGKKKSLEYLSYIKENINETKCMITDYHTYLFIVRKKVYENLSKVELDDIVLDTPLYDHSGVTGRTSIKKGFNFLTLKKELRKNIKPLNKEMCLVEVDFKSCEPFFYLKSLGNEITGNDVYAWLCKKYGIPLANRDSIKRGILSMIYGANEKTTSRFMKVSMSKIKTIKNDLKINLLEDSLKEEFAKNGFFLNYYGRPITSNNNVVNYYIQSSTVDFCSFSFSSFCNKNKVLPSYFIHDSMTFQCKKSKLDEIVKQKEICDPYSKISIPVEFNVIYR